MTNQASKRRPRCAIYTRVSTDSGLDQDFNSLDNQREAAEAYIQSQAHEGWISVKALYDDGGFSGASMERPALQRLLADVRSGLIDIVVVYKVDRLTRSLTDFAKLVELFDANHVSFVSVTQAFNTTTSMGRLTLNVLLSFAQFEREVTSERIRDKIAASKKRGLWMGGTIPLGYESRNKKLVVVEEEAERVRLIFRRYLELGSLDHLMRDLRARGIVTKLRQLANGRTIGGIPFTRGPLGYLLHNRFYIGEVVYRGSVSTGEHEALLDRDLFEAVQERLAAQTRPSRCGRARSGALLIGKLFDDGGNRMTPTHAKKGGARYRYYVSCALLQGRSEEAGSVARVAAPEIEAVILQILRERWPAEPDNHALIACHLDRVILQSNSIELTMREPATLAAIAPTSAAGNAREAVDGEADDVVPLLENEEERRSVVLTIPWSRASSARRREIVPPTNDMIEFRPIRSETRATLVRGIALGRRWLAELADGSVRDIVAIADREECRKRHVAMTISLAFLAPDLVKYAVEGRLPRGVGLRDAVDLPVEWSRQHQTLGL